MAVTATHHTCPSLAVPRRQAVSGAQRLLSREDQARKTTGTGTILNLLRFGFGAARNPFFPVTPAVHDQATITTLSISASNTQSQTCRSGHSLQTLLHSMPVN
ncbi:hypothetical protein CERZMDRAFT_90757 [Cercospora zeae-maydis SCOH1-5]|uniref:Uncharacterized protein n=1 Tax=Cercospora zeae-maydis SCOH1-5 TaxID=717836 RepID=A0A6A6FG89_9PEZI|nr:hypothetical protein CERZMDRAFT_90757 [Cercospora zeae-maydis SCOH1-5]